MTVNLGFVQITNEMLALGIFLLAAATDLLDGYLARRWGQITTVGTLLDPIADKCWFHLPSLAGRGAGGSRVDDDCRDRTRVRDLGLAQHCRAEGYIIKASDFGKAEAGLASSGDQPVDAEHAVAGASDRRHRLDVVRCCADCASAILYFRSFWRKVDIKVKRRRRRELLMKQARERHLLKQHPLVPPESPPFHGEGLPIELCLSSCVSITLLLAPEVEGAFNPHSEGG